MKKIIISLIAASTLLPLSSSFADEVQLKTDKDKVSYSIGQQIGTNFRQQKLDVNIDIFLHSIEDSFKGKPSLLTQQEMQEVLQSFQKKMMAKMQAEAKVSGKKNKKEGEKFLSENEKKKGVMVTTSGLQYKIIKAGTGKTPVAEDTVETHYRGTLIDGTEFDSSYKRNQTATFPVGGVIKGWTEALQLMKEGAKWELYIPSDLAYGSRGSMPKIEPDSTLIFEIELVAVK